MNHSKHQEMKNEIRLLVNPRYSSLDSRLFASSSLRNWKREQEEEEEDDDEEEEEEKDDDEDNEENETK